MLAIFLSFLYNQLIPPNKAIIKQRSNKMKTLTIGNIEFNIELIVGSPVGQLIIMHSAKCIQTGRVYNKDKANKYYRLYSA